jgi:acyl transferase domain-containing protein
VLIGVTDDGKIAGDQAVGMARELYRTETAFHEALTGSVEA